MKSFVLRLLTLISLFCSLYPHETEISSSYELAQQCNLPSLDWPEEDWPNESFEEYLNRCLHYQAHPAPIKIRRVGFQLFKKLTSNRPQNHSVISDITTIKNLEILAGQEIGAPYLGSIINHTKTELGTCFLYNLLITPTDDIQLLEQRQAIIRYLIEHETLLKELQEILNEISRLEKILLSFWAQDGFVQSSERHYFSLSSFNKLNNSPLAIEARSLLYHQERLSFVITAAAATILLPWYGLSRLFKDAIPVPFPTAANNLQASSGRIFGILSTIDNTITQGITAIIAGLYAYWGIKGEYEWMRDNFIIDLCLQKKMIYVARFFRALKKLRSILQKHPTLQSLCQETHAIAEFFEKTVHEHTTVQQLGRLLQKNTFKGKPSFFSNHGNILVGFRLMYAAKGSLEPLLLALGELDAYQSIATLFLNHQNTNARFCFVEYTQSWHPTIIMKGFWNPFVKSNNVITNDLILLSPDQKGIILTGPNAAGKSTILKGTILNLILAQSIGLAAATSLVVTPFFLTGTYLNVTDDLSGGNSLFKAQVLRAQEMINLVEKTPPGHFSFIALDELFNGTSTKESTAAAYAVGEHVSKFNNAMCILATHHPLLTTLENPTTGFKNFHVSAQLVGDHIHYPFTLQPGISDQHIV